MLTIIKVWALLSLLFGATWAAIGWRVNKRREELTELEPVIRAEEII